MPSILIAILVALATCQVALLATTVYLHRTLSHRSLRLSPASTWTLRVILWLTTGIQARQWVAVHRKHHAFTDAPGDPHSPILEGFTTVLVGNVALYRRVAKDKTVVARYARDLGPDRADRILFDHALLGLAIGVGILTLALGWRLALIAAAIHAVTYLLASGAINAVGHTVGRRPYDNMATNNRWLALIVAGEGLHNNHHAAPTSARLSIGRHQLDPGWWVITLLHRVGQATIRHSEPKLAPSAPIGRHPVSA